MTCFRLFDLTKDWSWFTKLNPIKRVEDTTGLVAYDEATGEPQGAIVLDSFTGNSCQCHIALIKPICLRHGLIEQVAKFMFDTCQLKLALGIVPANNERALRLNKKIGFKRVVEIDDAFDDGIGIVIMKMTRNSCNYLR